MKKNIFLIGGVVAAMATVGCGGRSGYLVAFSQCNNNEPYRAAQNELMTKLWEKKSEENKAAGKKAIDFVIQDAQQDDNKQIEQIRNFIKQKPDLLIVAPNQSAPLTEVMGEAMTAGIPVVCLERSIDKPNYTTFIKCDNKAIGRMAGEFIVEFLKKKYGEERGNIVQFEGLKGVVPEHERNDSAAAVYGKYPGIKVVHSSEAKWLQEDATTQMAEALSANPKIDVVYGHNDPMAIGAYLAAKDKGREKDMIFVGVDGLPGKEGGIAKVNEGVLAATFIYPLCVDKAVDVGYKILMDPNFKPEKEYMMDSQKVTKENAAKLLEEEK